METTITIEGIADLSLALSNAGYPVGAISVKPYGFDSRIGWDTHMVTIDGNAVGFTDGPLEGEAQ